MTQIDDRELELDLQREPVFTWELLNRLTRIVVEATRELARIERDGGETGFALRVRAIARGDG